MNNRKLYKLLDSLIGSKVEGLILDKNQISSNLKITEIIDVVEINFSDKISLSISATDVPHFIGEGDLFFSLEKKKKIIIPDSYHLKINQIKVFGYQPIGFNIFPSKNIVQIEFIESFNRLISIGFYSVSEQNTFIGDGYLSITFNKYFDVTSNERISVLYEKGADSQYEKLQNPNMRTDSETGEKK